MVPIVPDLWRDGLKTLCGMDRMPALPALRCSAAARRPVVGFKAQQGRHGVCPRGAATRQRPRPAGPRCPDTLANHSVQLHRRDLEAWYHGTMRALAAAGIFGAQGTGMVDATELATTAADEGRGPATRTRKVTDKQGRVHELEVAVYGWQPIGLSDARTKLPLAVKGVPIHAPEGLSRRALVTPARTHLAGASRRHQVIFARGVWDGVARGWLDPQGLTCVGPAHDHLAVTAAARAPAAAGEGITVGRACTRGATGRGQPPGGNGGRPRWWASPG